MPSVKRWKLELYEKQTQNTPHLINIIIHSISITCTYIVTSDMLWLGGVCIEFLIQKVVFSNYYQLDDNNRVPLLSFTNSFDVVNEMYKML